MDEVTVCRLPPPHLQPFTAVVGARSTRRAHAETSPRSTAPSCEAFPHPHAQHCDPATATYGRLRMYVQAVATQELGHQYTDLHDATAFDRRPGHTELRLASHLRDCAVVLPRPCDGTPTREKQRHGNVSHRSMLRRLLTD